MKRMICMLTAALVLFASAGLAETAPAAEDAELLEMLSHMTLREKVAQMMFASFRTWKVVPEKKEGEEPAEEPPAVNMTEMNDEVREMIGREHFGGILFFAENFADAEQTVRLVADMQETNRASGGIPMFFAADQEGGNIVRICFASCGVGNMALGATGDPENARRSAAILGGELGLLGIQVDFAPVLDVNSNPANPVIGVRSFSDDPEVVAAYGCAYLDGLHETGTVASLKHFPGHGSTDTDSHTGLPLVNSTYEELKAGDLIPFQAAIDHGADMVMTAHIQFPEIEKGTYTSVSTGEEIFLPATMSRRILTDILRGDMGFDGVIVSDALDMAAIADNFSVEDTLRLTIGAGVDMLILPAVKDTDMFRLTEEYVDTAVALVESGEIPEERINESVLRILKLKKKYGLLEQTDFAATDERIAAAKAGVGSAEHRETERQICEKALTLLRNENEAFPLRVKAGEKTLILFADSAASRAGAGELARKTLTEEQALPEGAEITVMVNNRENGDECVQAAKDADHVILVNRVYSAACMDPATDDGFSTGTFDRVIEAVHENGGTVILVSAQLPYDAARFPEADAVLLSYCSNAIPELPGEGDCWTPNLPAALCAAFGVGEPRGKIPVRLPEAGSPLPSGEAGQP